MDSILKQTFRDFEVLLIDDGSTDRSGAICDAYAEKDARVRVVHKENGGPCDARNHGLDLARGTFVSFIDSDDFVDAEMLETLYQLMQNDRSDIAICGVRDCFVGKSVDQSSVERTFVCTGEEGLRYTLEGRELPGSLCSKLIRLDRCGAHRFITGKTYEDAFYTPELFLSAEKVSVTTRSMYNYWHRADSITTKPFSSQNMDVIEAYQHTLDIISARCPDLIPVAKFRVYWAHFVVLDKILMTEGYQAIPEYQPTVSYLKKHWKEVACCPYFLGLRRIAAVALKLHVRLYKVLVSLNTKRYGVNQ